MPFTAITWNIQGNPANDPLKYVTLNQLLDGRPDVVMLQEVGDFWGFIGLDYQVCRGRAVGAYNSRCTNCVLVHNRYHIHNSVMLNVTAGGVAGRTAAYALTVARADQPPLLLISWHATATPAGADSSTSALLTYLSNSMHRNTRTIIGGDFNSDPRTSTAINSSVGMGSSSRPGPLSSMTPQIVVPEPNLATHDNGSILDYFITLNAAGAGITRIEAEVLSHIVASDHRPVALTIS